MQNQNQNQKQDEEQQERKISYSELKIWNECPYKHKLVYIDKEPYFSGNHYTAFGTAIHKICESLVTTEDTPVFRDVFDDEIGKLDDPVEPTIIEDMTKSASRIIPEVLDALEQIFGKYEVVSIEEKLFEDINDFNAYGKSFKGYIDLVLKTEDGNYHIIDWKTCSWGWDSRRKSDRMTNYQLVLYKKYFSLKHGIEPSKIETYFGLLKRTAKKDPVEIFKVSSGTRRVKNATDLLKKAINNIESGTQIKNKLSCNRCYFFERCNGEK